MKLERSCRRWKLSFATRELRISFGVWTKSALSDSSFSSPSSRPGRISAQFEDEDENDYDDEWYSDSSNHTSASLDFLSQKSLHEFAIEVGLV